MIVDARLDTAEVKDCIEDLNIQLRDINASLEEIKYMAELVIGFIEQSRYAAAIHTAEEIIERVNREQPIGE